MPHRQLKEPRRLLGVPTHSCVHKDSHWPNCVQATIVLLIYGYSHILCAQMVSMDGVNFFSSRALRSQRSENLAGDVSGDGRAEGSIISNAFAMVLDTENQRKGRRE